MTSVVPEHGSSLRRVLEAVLLVVDEPVTPAELSRAAERGEAEVEAALTTLAAEYDDEERGFELRRVGGGWRLYSREDCADQVERFVLEGQRARLTTAALETLAVVAYRQPVTRARISAIRGVSVDGVIRTLLSRGLVTESGTDGETGAVLYGTSPYFLERLGLASLDDLPSLAPLLPDLEDLDDAAAPG